MYLQPNPSSVATPFSISGTAFPNRKTQVFVNKKNRSVKKPPVSIQIVGLILSASYQKCKHFALKLRKHHAKKFLEPRIKGYLEMDWVEYLNNLQRDLGGQTWAVKTGVVVFVDGIFIGGETDIIKRFELYALKHPPSETITKLAKQEYLSYLNNRALMYTFFELSVDGKYMGSLLFELQHQLLPKTTTRFAFLSDPNNHLGQSYKGTRIHRVCRSGWFQGGGIRSSSSLRHLEDESFCYKHDRRGVLSFASDGKDTNKCQFFVTFKPSQWMDEYYVAFGRVVEGSDVLRRLENTKCFYEYPNCEITVSNCGVVEVGLGKHFASSKLKGLTVGEVHIDPTWVMDLVLDRFSEVLLDRLDPEVKSRLHGEWTTTMLWEQLLPKLMVREPAYDYPDENDRSSKLLLTAQYLKGLYGLQEIPDHFIMELLNQIIDDAVARSDVKRMSRSIVDFLIDSLDLERRTSGVMAAQSFVNRLSMNVDRIIHKSQDSGGFQSASSRELFIKLVPRETFEYRSATRQTGATKSNVAVGSSSRPEVMPSSGSKFGSESEFLNEFLSVAFKSSEAAMKKDSSLQRLNSRESLEKFIRELLVQSMTK